MPQAEGDAAAPPGLTTQERYRLEQLEWEKIELRRTNGMLRLASTQFAKAELDTRAVSQLHKQ